MLAVVVLAGLGQALAQGTKVAFDVVSIRQNMDGTPACGPEQARAVPSGFRMRNCHLTLALAVAYLPSTGEELGFALNDRIVGVPGWFMNERYDMDARISEADVERWNDPVQQKEMLRGMMESMLVERCRLVVHRERKEKPVYALVVGKNGAKLKTAEAVEMDSIRAKHPNALPAPGGGGMFAKGRTSGSLELYGVPMSTLALLLSERSGRPVVDRTGLSGRYDVSLDWGKGGDEGPSIFSVVQEQLGLKLEPSKGPVEVLVVDHVERPSEN